MRYERKYRLENETLSEVFQMIRLHPASFRTLYPPRQVNNIYFDTRDLLGFRQNIAGQNERRKYRVRWYGEEVKAVSKPRFEIKRKHNELGDKLVSPIGEFDFEHLDELTEVVNRFNLTLPNLRPTLLNSYRRAYFLSADGHYRLTVDDRLRYHSLLFGAPFEKYQIRDAAIIVEIKYEIPQDNQVGFITQNLPYRQSRHSKYLTGVQLTQ